MVFSHEIQSDLSFSVREVDLTEEEYSRRQPATLKYPQHSPSSPHKPDFPFGIPRESSLSTNCPIR